MPLIDRATFPSDIPHGHFVHRHAPLRLPAELLPEAAWARMGPRWDAGLHKDPILALGICDAMRDVEFLADAIADGSQRPSHHGCGVGRL